MRTHHNRRALAVAMGLAVALGLAGCGSGDDSAAGTSAPASSAVAADFYGAGPDTDIGGPQSGLRDQRYCEVLPVTRDGREFTSTIYNTVGLSDCPADKWDAVTEDKVNEAYGSLKATLNGPRFWVLDGIEAQQGTDSASQKTWYFGGIQFGDRGTVVQSAQEAHDIGAPYVVKNVTRHTTWKYDAGKPVFELTAPDGAVYTMQSYSHIVDDTLTYDGLADLGATLRLPDGWTYSTRMLDEPLDNVADGTAYVVQDDLSNSYMRRPSA